MDTASSVAVVALQPYMGIKDEISPQQFWEQIGTETPLMPLTPEIQHVTGQDSTCRGSNHQLMLMTEWKSTLFLPGLLVTRREDGFDMEKGTARGRREEGPLKDEFLSMAPHQLNHQGHERKKFSAEHWHWDQDLHLKYDSNRAEHSLPQISRCLSTGSQYKMKPLYSVKAMPDTNNCFHVKSWWLVPI